MNVPARLIRLAAISTVAVLSSGCATSNTPGDPFEGFNRGVFGVIEGFDRAVVKPIAKAYAAVVPEPARDCVSNAFAKIFVKQKFWGFGAADATRVSRSAGEVAG